MGLSKLAARCRACPLLNICDHKQMEAYGFLFPAPSQQNQEALSQPKMSEQLILTEPVIDVADLMKQIAKEAQLPERLLRGDY